jgi:DNA-nicking Smr family endonuclease
MSKSPHRDGDLDAFAKAMRGVDRLADESRRVEARPRRPARVGVEPEVEFETETWGDHQQGAARGTGTQHLRRLESGKHEPELSLDLHGMTEGEARKAVRAALRQAHQSGMRCLRIIHGRGLRSPEGPILKRALPRWLAQPPHGRRVLAFTTAGKHGASGGATLVLLRKRRQ